MKKSEMTTFFKDQIKLEHNIVESVTNSLKNVRSPVVKQVLRAIAFDSQKHAGIYNAAMSIVKITPALTDQEYRELEKITAKHIVDEERAIVNLDKIMPEIKDKKIRFLLESIVADERKHHKLLTKIMELVVKKEAITEEDWWEILWKNVPFHGTPGG
ncbi:MAG: ferritin-like domain-containing protein [Candidatus Bathyarchaeota archaeon]|nr:MAG: ferritin-like domain-containing protein [Candidatus Bathyarchaeota archaeon]